MVVATAARVAAILIAIAIAGCGAISAPPTPESSESPTSFALRVTYLDDGRTVNLTVGERMDVILVQQAGYMPWQQPVSSDLNVLQSSPASGGAVPQGTTDAAFRGVRAGSAELMSFAAILCSPGAYCQALARTWRVMVMVV